MRKHLGLAALCLFLASAARSQTPPALSIPPESSRRDLQGVAKPAEHLGRKCLLLDGGENDAVYLPLKKGTNELLLTVSQPGSGWGFLCRLGETHESASRLSIPDFRE